MKAEEYFGDWIDKQELRKVVTWINKTIEVYHPAYFSRKGTKMPSSVFTDINEVLKKQYNYQIEFYKETEYGIC